MKKLVSFLITMAIIALSPSILIGLLVLIFSFAFYIIYRFTLSLFETNEERIRSDIEDWKHKF
jgi:hypothetical protein